jgi:hypothetical protein
VTARDDARAHPTVDELADLGEGLLSTADEARVRDHLDGCAACAAEVAAIDEVVTVLRDAGAEPVTIPDSVARAIDDALQQAAATPSSRPVPERTASGPVPSRRRWVKPAFGWLAGAAAAVIVIGGIGVGLRDLGSQSNDSSASDTGGGRGMAAGRQPESSPTTGDDGDYLGPGKRGHDLKHLSENSLRSFARDIVGQTAEPQTTNSSGDAAYADRCGVQGMGRLKQPVIWHGTKALVVVRREARVASVYSCDATPRLLYSAPY